MIALSLLIWAAAMPNGGIEPAIDIWVKLALALVALGIGKLIEPRHIDRKRSA